ncbi:galactose-3-O-sulfotransferase 3 isoform X1 [Hydra vulgaris]|uniref:galactose-3-O-sulfotransferase 3 isoform X1 n=1 Tax=Hydra vulgaris TaxID=6087 RepID=UPI001F5F0D42|nr:galactose-3-O-sulfotransferase 3-like [Hydra vulgaris]
MNIYRQKKSNFKRLQLLINKRRTLFVLIMWILTLLVFYTSSTGTDGFTLNGKIFKSNSSFINKEFEKKTNSNSIHRNEDKHSNSPAIYKTTNAIYPPSFSSTSVDKKPANQLPDNFPSSNLASNNLVNNNLAYGKSESEIPPFVKSLFQNLIFDNQTSVNLVSSSVASVNPSKNSSPNSLYNSVNYASSSSSDVIHIQVRQNPIKTNQNVIFLKTHKTGSSTVTNILQRYALSHHLNVALPRCDHRFCYPNKFEEAYLYEHQLGETYNILFNHAVFHKEKMLQIMSSGVTKIVTIVREPFSQFDSAAQYLNFRKYFNLSNDSPILDEFLKIPVEHLKRYIQSVSLNEGEGAFALAKNPNAFDLGFDVWNETPEYIQYVLNSITQDFSLVMIMEYMEESLVLLKNEMNWELEDILFYALNARGVKEKSTNNFEKTKEKVLSWNKLDAAIYRHFNETFWLRIKSSSSDFYAEVNKLKEWNIDLVNHCNGLVTTTSLLLVQKYNQMSNSILCSDVFRDDILFTTQFKSKRYARINAKF